MLRLHSWPELAALPSELLQDAARLCALLSIRPTAATLLPPLLGIDRERAIHILENLELGNHLRVPPRQRDARAAVAALEDAHLAPASPSAVPAFLAKLWRRLAAGR